MANFIDLVSTKILKISKQLFADIVLDLGIKHPESVDALKTSVDECVTNVVVLVKSLWIIFEQLIEFKMFGRGAV